MNLLSAFIPMIGYGVIDALTAGTSKRVPVFYFVFLQNSVTMLLFAIVLFFVFPEQLTYTHAAFYPLLGGFFLVLGFMSFLKGLSVGKAGVITAFAHGYILVSAILGMLLLGETTSIVRIAAILIVLFGLTLLSVDFKNIQESSLFKRESGLIYAFGAMVFWGIGYLFQKIGAESLPLFETAFLVELGAFVVPLSLFLFTRKPLARYKDFQRYDIGVILGVAVGFFIIQTALITAFTTFELGLVATIAGSSSIITAILSYFFYQQRLNTREIIGIMITVCGLGLLGWFS